MDGIVSVQTLSHQPFLGRADRRLVSHRDLILDEHMKGDVERLTFDAGFVLLNILEDEAVTFAFVGGEPCFGVRGLKGIVRVNHEMGRGFFSINQLHPALAGLEFGLAACPFFFGTGDGGEDGVEFFEDAFQAGDVDLGVRIGEELPDFLAT